MSEQETFFGIHVKFMGKSETQYKEFLKVMLKMGSKISWTNPVMDPETKEFHSFINFRGSTKYVEQYSL